MIFNIDTVIVSHSQNIYIYAVTMAVIIDVLEHPRTAALGMDAGKEVIGIGCPQDPSADKLL